MALHHLLLKEKALELHNRAAGYLLGNNRANNALHNLPESIDGVPWRRIYAQTGTYVATGLNDVVWTPTELSRGGNGSMWCFTLLPRGGKNGQGNVVRSTDVDGESWNSRTGRCPKNGFPKTMLVDKLRIGCFEMLELTAVEDDKPIVALCKITRKKNTAPAQKRVTVPSVHNEVGASSSQQIHDLSNIITEMPHMMEECQIQEVNPEIPAHDMPVVQMLIDGYFGSTPSEGETIWGAQHSTRQGTNSIFWADAFNLDDLTEWVDGYDGYLNQAAVEVELDGNEEEWVVVGHPDGHEDQRDLN